MDLMFHYQWVQTGKGSKVRYTCHEAYSIKDVLYAVNPIPVEPEDSVQDQAMETDLERYGVRHFKDIQKHVERYTEDIECETFSLPNYEDEDEYLLDTAYDKRGNIIDLVEFMKRNK